MPGDVEGQLAAEPAAAELAGIAARLRTADPGAVRASAAQVLAIGDGVEGSVRTVDRGRASVEGRWEGEGAAAFGEWVGTFGKAGERDRRAITDAGTTLDGISTALEGLKREVDQQVAQALALAGAARSQAAATPDAPPDLGDRMAADALRGPIEAARAAVQRAEAELAGAATRLRGLADGITTFTALAGPDAAVMAPPPGTPLPWRPVEVPGSSGPGGSPGGGSAGEEGGGGGNGGGGNAGGNGGGGSSGTPTGTGAPVPSTGTVPPGEVGDWIREAMAILAAHGVPPEKMDPAAIAMIIEHESGGDPNAVNTVDSNAAKGTPSQGLMQTIGPTFDAHKLPGHGDIRNPVDNIIAGVRYAVERYGSVSQVPGVLAEAKGEAYVGY
ncbi:type VII secretion system (Wss) protein ESAT-6 [Actinomycetospora succinea]|uniref:Type VII secretion system (Wss) protein ESAT-6 n=1 Tax=Actinomycetospora succinea TaxID=663603 RepID=A0A4R6UYZ9_9PSEU|nr:transglycosylase SLT domain-containing protein [Actinomycetospora succinea]TDQ52674.1 type VII secretion system (Wss) protein ESAT-6 [Actinomycetospora succinea]